VQWFIDSGLRRLFAAYLFTVVCFTYLAALIFYDYEVGINHHLHGFGNALWWAWMGVTTVGAQIFPVTAIGKVLAVLLPALGMMFFPIFTIYITNIYSLHKDE
jgi:voltage-gated potassium channel